MPYDAVFNANEVAPQQVGGKHHVGNKFPATITNTEAKKVKDKDAGLFAVTFTSPGGSIVFNYNLWNESEQARKIAQGQLSALCHATGRFQLNFRNDGAELRGAQCLIDVGYQSGQEPSAEKPEGGYVEIKKIYDMAGNEPGKAAPAQSQQQSYQQGSAQQPQGGQQGGPQVQTGNFNPNPSQANQQAPNNAGGGWNSGGQQQQPNQANNNGGGWNNQPQQNTQQQQPQGGGWNNNQQQQPQQNNTGGGWQQNNGGNVPQSAPWGNNG